MHQLGMNCVLFFKVGGIAGGGAWLAANNVRDATLNMEANETDVTTRGNAGWEATAPTLRKASVDTELIWAPAEPFFTALKNAFMAVSAAERVIGIRAMSAASDGEGLQADMAVSKFSRSEDLEDAVKVSVTLKPTYSATPPTWITN